MLARAELSRCGLMTVWQRAASKAALNTYCQGLRALLAPNGVVLLTVKLGYMDTRLAYGLAPRACGTASFLSPPEIGRGCHYASWGAWLRHVSGLVKLCAATPGANARS